MYDAPSEPSDNDNTIRTATESPRRSGICTRLALGSGQGYHAEGHSGSGIREGLYANPAMGFIPRRQPEPAYLRGKWQVHGEGSESQGPTELVLVGSGSYEQSWRAIPTHRYGGPGNS